MHPGASAHLPRPSTYTHRRVPTWLAAAPVRKSGTRATAEKVTRSPSPSFAVPDTFTYDDGDANLCLCLGPIPRACRLSAIFTICWNCSKPLARSVRPFASASPVLSLVLRLFDGCFARIPDDEMATIHPTVLYHPIHSSTPSDFIHLRPSSPPHTPSFPRTRTFPSTSIRAEKQT